MKEQNKFHEAKLDYEIDSSDLLESINSGNSIKVIDTRSSQAFAIEHISNAISLPHRDMSVESTKEFDKEYVYVTYCDGIGCNASTKGALNMSRLGFNVKELLGGLDWWKRDGYKTEGQKGSVGVFTELCLSLFFEERNYTCLLRYFQ